MVEHHSIVNLVLSNVDYFGLGPGDRVGQSSSVAYDSSVEEIWLAFACGATLVVMDDDVVRLGSGPRALAARRADQHVLPAADPAADERLRGPRARPPRPPHPLPGGRGAAGRRRQPLGARALARERLRPDRVHGHRGARAGAGRRAGDDRRAGAQRHRLRGRRGAARGAGGGDRRAGDRRPERDPRLSEPPGAHAPRSSSSIRTSGASTAPATSSAASPRGTSPISAAPTRRSRSAATASSSRRSRRSSAPAPACARRPARCRHLGRRQGAGRLPGPRSRRAPDLDFLRADLRAKLPEPMVPVRFALVAELPASPSSGKLDRKALPDLPPEAVADRERGGAAHRGRAPGGRRLRGAAPPRRGGVDPRRLLPRPRRQLAARGAGGLRPAQVAP